MSFRRWFAGFLLLCFVFLTLRSRGSFPVRPENVLRRQDEGWRGVLCVRVRDTTTGGMLLPYVQKAARAFEKTHPGVNFYVESVTQEALRDGMQADMLLFSHGAQVDTDRLLPLIGGERVIPAFLHSGFSGGQLLAMPVAADGYLVLHNPKGESTQTLCPNNPMHSTLCAYAAQSDAAGQSLTAESVSLLSRTLAWPTFILEGQSSAYVGTGSYELKRAAILESSGRAIPWEGLSAEKTYTDLVCYASIVRPVGKDDGGASAQMCASFLGFLLSEEGQALLKGCRLFSVTRETTLYGKPPQSEIVQAEDTPLSDNETASVDANDPMAVLEKNLHGEVLVPNVFAFPGAKLPESVEEARIFLQNEKLFGQEKS